LKQEAPGSALIFSFYPYNALKGLALFNLFVS